LQASIGCFTVHKTAKISAIRFKKCTAQQEVDIYETLTDLSAYRSGGAGGLYTARGGGYEPHGLGTHPADYPL
jgi:hypothetical protein